ncbi:MAG: chemotaxis response regulator protein-glutamate methylesterase [Actinobacteria bacterium]|nr:chemotaxis response regulator protein-glutamate methylesterase [Actinomycetota bacterium]
MASDSTSQTTNGPIRVLVVDDAVAVRRLMTMLFQSEPELELAGIAQDGLVALEKIGLLKPDIISLDLAMPNMDGLTMLREMRERGIDVPVIMFSTLTHHGAKETIEGLALGAADYVTKPTHYDNPMDALEAVRAELVPRIKAIVRAAQRSPESASAPAAAKGATAGSTSSAGSAGSAASSVQRSGKVEAIVIGSSTGGPNALAEVISRLPGNLRVPVLIAQHMPPVYTTYLAQRLDSLSALTVREAVDGEPLQSGTVYIAPGDHHLTLRPTAAGATVALTQSAPVNHCRPSVDVLFSSAAAIWGKQCLAIVLTGMGHDGRDGAVELHGLGAQVLVQDEATSVVWGMPGAVHDAGVADEVLPIDKIAAAAVRLTAVGSGFRRSAPAAPSTTSPDASPAAGGTNGAGVPRAVPKGVPSSVTTGG